MLQLRFSPKAEADLEDIWLHTLENWGQAQANEYLLSLDRTLELLCTHPLLGASIQHVRPGYRRMPMTSHIIIYRVTAESLEIIRILQKSMDVDGYI